MTEKPWKVITTIPRTVRRRVLSELTAREQPGRALEVRPDDTFIVSYPKSGNTWVRFLVASLLHPGTPTDFGNIDVRVPTIYKSTARELAALPAPRVLKSHEYLDPRYPRVVNVVRDPRDVLVSYYHYSMRKGFIADTGSIEAFADDFLAGKLNTFGTWKENVAGWLAAREGSPRFIVVRYEDLKADCETELARIAAVLQLAPSRAELGRVVAECSFEKMRDLERATGEQSAHMKHKRSEIAFVRSGRAGGWKTELPASVVARVDAEFGPVMSQLGYQGGDDLRHAAEERPR